MSHITIDTKSICRIEYLIFKAGFVSEINFEKSLERLEEIASRLEEGKLTLDDSLKMFEEGIKLAKVCESKLGEAEKRVEILKNSDPEEIDILIESNKKNLAPKSNPVSKKKVKEVVGNIEITEDSADSDFLF